MIIDCNLITYYTAEEILPYPQYPSGEKGDDSIYRFAKEPTNYPTLLVEEDIVFKNKTGIKKGFYQAVLSSDFDSLLLYESGKLKAKIPVVSIEQRKDVKPAKQKVQKQSIWKKPKKNNRGKDSEDFTYQNAALYYDQQNKSYVIIYERGNTKAVGVIKL